MPNPVYKKVGNSRTAPQPRGKTIPVLPTEDNAYLCSHICQCNCNPIRSKNGWKLKQRCVTLGIRSDTNAAGQIWRYKGEVGYNMTQNPPTPIMSAILRNQPFQFPLSVIRNNLPEKIVESLAKAQLLGRAPKGMLRIPDVIIVKDMHDLALTQDNIEYVVEIKFDGDRLRRDQFKAYVQIAGSRKRFIVLRQKDCDCPSCDEEKERKTEKSKAPSKVPARLTAPDITGMLPPPIFPPRQPQPAPVPQPVPAPVPIDEELRKGGTRIGHVGMAKTPHGWRMYIIVAGIVSFFFLSQAPSQ